VVCTRGSRAGCLLAAAVPLLLSPFLAACNGGELSAPAVVQRLEHCFLARLDPPLTGWMFCDRFELTRGEYQPESLAGDRDLPQVMISQQEFQAWALPQGLRTPTVAEWRALAGSPDVDPTRLALSRNTLDLGTGTLLPVGVFERGRSPLGGYDFYGNVRELAGPVEEGRYFALGGSFATRATGTDARDAVWVEAGERADDIGVRYVMEVLPYLREQVLPAWQADPGSTKPVLVRAAQRWRMDLRIGLAAQLRRDGFPADFVALLAP
jgi:hypothetical protein